MGRGYSHSSAKGVGDHGYARARSKCASDDHGAGVSAQHHGTRVGAPWRLPASVGHRNRSVAHALKDCVELGTRACRRARPLGQV